MSGIVLEQIPDPARAAWLSLHNAVREILGDDLVAMWAHGGSARVDDPPHAGDVDTHVIVSSQPDDVRARRLEAAADAIERGHGVELDTWYVRIDDARLSDRPRHAWRDYRRDTSWALHRAHWLAGRYAGLYGPEPAAVVKAPTWEELEWELSRELEHIERHVFEGDTDGYEAIYAILNGGRILHAVETRDVAISKREAGAWALTNLPRHWRPAIQAALRSYEGGATTDDVALLAQTMAPFVAFARERLPDVDDRPAGAPPRWSGS